MNLEVWMFPQSLIFHKSLIPTEQSTVEHFDFLSGIYNLTNLLNVDNILHVSGAGSSYDVQPNCLVTVDRWNLCRVT